jgi:hypothetical protein
MFAANADRDLQGKGDGEVQAENNAAGALQPVAPTTQMLITPRQGRRSTRGI